MGQIQNLVNEEKKAKGLYRSVFEHDNCGIGAVVSIRGEKTHKAVEHALKIVENLEHRAGKDAEGKTGDGVGILLQISHRFFSKVCREEAIPIGEEREYGIAQIFFRKMKENAGRRKRCLKSLWKKKD